VDLADSGAEPQAADPVEPVGPGRFLRGLFSGGTLAVEAVLGLQNVLHPLLTNVPIDRSQDLGNPMQSRSHTLVDLGDDVFTQGRLHPMLDNDLRIRRLRQEAQDPTTGLVLLDVVLGEGAHPDPAAELAPAIAEVIGTGRMPVLVVVIGTMEDPQDLESQAERFRAAGAEVFHDLQSAVRRVAAYFPAEPLQTRTPFASAALTAPFEAVNAGLAVFFDSLAAQGAGVVQLDWRPPAGGNEKLAGILARLKG
jgi:FdrA protein